MLKKLFIVLGADNAGKTTTIDKSRKFCQETLDKTTDYLHFSAPKTTDPYTLWQYDRALQDIEAMMQRGCDRIYLDRAWQETRFYEKSRSNKNVSLRECYKMEQKYLILAKKYNYKIAIYVMFKPWFAIKQYHVEELADEKLAAEQNQKTGEFKDLEARRAEHHAYYRYMLKYSRQRQLNAYAAEMPWSTISVFDREFVLV